MTMILYQEMSQVAVLSLYVPLIVPQQERTGE